MKTLIALLAASCAMFAQSTTTPAAPAKTTLPDWAGIGAIYGTADNPHFSGWAALAVPVSNGAGLWSFTLYQSIPQPNKVPTTSVTSGVGMQVRQLVTSKGTLYVIGIGTLGVATTTTATTGSFAGGALGVWKFPKGWTIEAGAIQSKAGGSSKPDVLVGFGLTW